MRERDRERDRYSSFIYISDISKNHNGKNWKALGPDSAIERQRERDAERERQTERQTDRERDRQRETERHRDRERHRETQRERQILPPLYTYPALVKP